MIIKTDAVVLKSMRFRDTSKIVTFYSRRFGKIKGIAKGARDTKSKFGAALEPLTLTALVLYRKEGRDLHLVSQADILRPYRNIHREFDRLVTGLSMLELVNHLTHDEEENQDLYNLLVETLGFLDDAQKGNENLLHSFELRLAALFGYAPSFDRCLKCGRRFDCETEMGSVLMDLTKGGLICQPCEMKESPLSQELSQRKRISMLTARKLQKLLELPLSAIPTLSEADGDGNEVEETVRLYLQRHFDEFRPLKAATVLRSAHAGG